MTKSLSSHFIGIYPAFILFLFFIGPLFLMLGVSFFERDATVFFNPAFQFDNYEKFASKRVLATISRSLIQASVAAFLSPRLPLSQCYL